MTRDACRELGILFAQRSYDMSPDTSAQSRGHGSPRPCRVEATTTSRSTRSRDGLRRRLPATVRHRQLDSDDGRPRLRRTAAGRLVHPCFGGLALARMVRSV